MAATVGETLLALEGQGWEALSSDAGAAFYAKHLTDDALLVVPGVVLDKATWLASLASAAPWSSHRIEDARVVGLGAGCAALVYRATAQRQGEAAYVALVTSTYVRRHGRWLLALHQQTPVPG